jgi:type II secretory pathway pseudopilin PulG
VIEACLLNQNTSLQLPKEEVKMKSLLKLLLKSQHQQNSSPQAQTEKGMTLIELLIGMVMAFLIITPMLAFVVDMLNTDRREQVKASTEQDIQAAVDFIAQDLSQAVHIYDGDGIRNITAFLPADANGTPILVFWKRKQIRNAIDPNRTITPSACVANTPPNGPNVCNDTYTRSLVAYYLVRQPTANSSWCQPTGTNCPSRIERYEISEGVRDLRTPPVDPSGYFSGADVIDSQRNSPAFNPAFDLSQPTQNVTRPTPGFTDPIFTGQNPQVLVNYIDHTPKTLLGAECTTALGNPTVTLPGQTTPTFLTESTLIVRDTNTNTNSFYACVDTSRNIARVTIRGNSLRRLQDSNTPSSANNSAFFPTASVQVQGRSATGQ